MRKLLFFSFLILMGAAIFAQEKSASVIQILSQQYDLTLFKGNIHSHTGNSDGRGTPMESCQWAENIQGYDFNIMTDHAMMLTKKEWIENHDIAKAYSKDSIQILVGFEWTSRTYNHANVYFTDDFVSAPRLPQLDKFYQWVDSRNAIVQFNHPRQGINEDWKQYQFFPALYDNITLIETANGKRLDVKSMVYVEAYMDALDAGWFLAPASSRDNHNLEKTVDDVTVMMLPELSNAAMETAMRERNLFASDSPNLDILLRYGDILMGTDQVSINESKKFIINVTSADAIKRIVIFTNSGDTAEVIENQPAGNLSWTPDVLPEKGQWYFLFVETEEDAAVSPPLIF